MITRILAAPKRAMESHLQKWPHLLEKLFVISICDPGESRPFSVDHLHLLKLTFCETSPDDIPASYYELYPPMNAAAAKAVVAFIKRCHDLPWRGCLIVHCNAGIARSGAVATFANEMLGLDAAQFQADNPDIEPYQYVLDLLRAALAG